MEVCMSKMRWETRSREDREGEPWSAEWQHLELPTSKVYDEDTKKISFSKRKVTEIPTNRRVFLPKPVDEKTEIGIRNLKNRVMETYQDYKKENCDEKGHIKKDNLSKGQRLGLKQCQEKAKAKEGVYNVTDKSNQFSADTPENYIEAKMTRSSLKKRSINWRR